MVVRRILLIAAISLALLGCSKNSLSSHLSKRAAHAARIGDVPAGPPLAPIMLRPSIQGDVRQVAATPANSYTLDSGDRLRVTVFGQENLSRIYPVDAGGFISMPLIGAVQARGLTTFQLEERISVTLKRKYVKDPKVTVEVAVSRPFFILGEVRNAGQFPYVAGMTVQTAIAIAGGFTPRARKNRIKLSTQINGATYTRTVPLTARIKPGDTVMVQERFF
ncbi:MAG TPA: polysaccharide export protein [Rhizobiales bacterium]|nr:polysialic acid transport protein KpsD precursor [bacterium BMS3Bbin10]HDO51536.1 polysaccharide export protein [Hyphomicrobiales bacterium]